MQSYRSDSAGNVLDLCREMTDYVKKSMAHSADAGRRKFVAETKLTFCLSFVLMNLECNYLMDLIGL